MKTLVVYSSLTGNTKMIAQAVAEELEGTLADVGQKPDPSAYDFIAVGFWVDRGTADTKAAEYLKGLKNKQVALFATLGADPSSEHARKSLHNAADLLDSSNTYCGDFICQGKIDPKLIEKMTKMFPPGHPHGMNEQRRVRQQAASTHPDAEDLKNARRAFAEMKVRMTGR